MNALPIKIQPESTSLAVHTPTPMDLLQLAMSQNADLDKLTKLMDLQERWEANEARKAFTEAMSAFKSESINVVKDKINKQYSTTDTTARYVSLGNLVGTVTPFLSKHGLSADWEIDQASGIKVTCVITHLMGHSKRTSLIVPPDVNGKKNAIQEIKSAITYAKACTFESACGLAASDTNIDDDGNGAAAGNGSINLNEVCEYITNAKDLAELQQLYFQYYDEAKKAKDQRAMAAILRAKDARKKELQ